MEREAAPRFSSVRLNGAMVLRVSSVIAAFSMASACHAQHEEMVSGYGTACLGCTMSSWLNRHISSDWV